MAVHPPGNRAARRTQTETSGRADRDNGPITIMVSTFDNKPTRHQTGAAKRLLHGADSLGKSTTRILNCIKFESEPRLDADHPEYGVLIPCRNTIQGMLEQLELSLSWICFPVRSDVAPSLIPAEQSPQAQRN